MRAVGGLGTVTKHFSTHSGSSLAQASRTSSLTNETLLIGSIADTPVVLATSSRVAPRVLDFSMSNPNSLAVLDTTHFPIFSNSSPHPIFPILSPHPNFALLHVLHYPISLSFDLLYPLTLSFGTNNRWAVSCQNVSTPTPGQSSAVDQPLGCLSAEAAKPLPKP
jgi:hypothetical protein